MKALTGAEAICRALVSAGVDTVFGLPGTQNVELFEALRHSKVRTVVASHELGAAFMANGYARASGRPGVLLTIPGPGFTYALTGLAEARLDSVPLVHILPGPAPRSSVGFPLQALDQAAMAAPACKLVLRATRWRDLAQIVGTALRLADTDEPGPVLVEIEPHLLMEVGYEADLLAPEPSSDPDLPLAPVREIASLLRASRRRVLYVGQGASSAAERVRTLAERLGAPVITTTSGRGILPEDHVLSRSLDFGSHAAGAINQIFRRSDLILVLGCKFSHNGAHGFRLSIPPEKLVQVDRSAATLAASFPARLSCRADVGPVLSAILDDLNVDPGQPSGWAAGEIAGIGQAARASFARATVEPRMRGLSSSSVEDFFVALGSAMPPGGRLLTDSGLHQMLARRYYTVRSARGLIVPTNLQSMGYAIPAALGAHLGTPEVPVVALVGDGGLVMSGLELLTAVREKVPLTVIVFNDGHFGLIRQQQLRAYGHAFATKVQGPDLEALAQAVGATYRLLEGNALVGLRAAFGSPGVKLVEVLLGEGLAVRRAHARGLVSGALRRLRRFRL